MRGRPDAEIFPVEVLQLVGGRTVFGLDTAGEKLGPILRVVLLRGVRLLHVAAINELAVNERLCKLTMAKIVCVAGRFMCLFEVLDDDTVDLLQHLLPTFF